ncbi:efflux transporter outer membrane subunit [Pseudomonas atacamensis]|uniref:Efflux transporter outer membrane subunit n=1 Tax=Pseudomonas atacamensis TaxID=2565368 RepID=A0AAQ2DF42_9PSED|nr:efflux transporter outer membrane subunit [Pseudomonas atacamensis]THF34515.1 efflux transporter outer membrane subunit [Pseudomonas atacamensis]
MKKAILPIFTGALLLSACAVGPNYHPPQTPGSAAQRFVGEGAPTQDDVTPADGQWWRLYNDSVLNDLIAGALSANTDLRVAVARLEKARSVLRSVKSDIYPKTRIDVKRAKQRVPDHLEANGEREYQSVEAGLGISYELDLFGRVRRAVESAHGDWQAAEADRDAVMVVVVADIVHGYADATTSAQRIAVAEQTVELLDRSMRITSARVETGRSDRLDLIQMKALRDEQRAELPPLRAQREAALFRLATLTGRTPHDLPARVLEAKTVPLIDQPIPLGDGAALIARRPDVRAAERRLAASTARIGVATADLYPRVSLLGRVGTNSVGVPESFSASSSSWLIGGLISWDFPNIAATRARIAGANADAQVSLASFDGAVLAALEETETALSANAHEMTRNEALREARDEALRAACISAARQREGTIDFLTVLDAQRTLAGAQATLAASDAQLIFTQVDLFKALGGGWQQAENRL